MDFACPFRYERNVLERWDLELSHLVGKDLDVERRGRTEYYLDQGVGSVWLKDPSVAKIVENALLYFDGLRYKTACLGCNAKSCSCAIDS